MALLILALLAIGTVGCDALACEAHLAREGVDINAGQLVGTTIEEAEVWVSEHAPSCVELVVTGTARPVPARLDGTVLAVCPPGVDGNGSRVTVLIADSQAEQIAHMPVTTQGSDGSTTTTLDASLPQPAASPCAPPEYLQPLD